MALPRIPVRLDAKWTMLVVALLAGAMAAWLSRQHIQSRIAQLEDAARAPTQAVVVAAADLPAGARIDADTVAVRDMPTEWVPTGAVGPAQFASIATAALASPLRRGEPVLASQLVTARPAGFAERVGEGRRAVTLPVDEISSVSGLLQPGDVIDLYVSFEHRGSPVTVPLLQGMKVLATGRQVDAARDGEAGAREAERAFSTVTLDASLDDAVKLIAARQGGSITAMLRSPGDVRPARAQHRGDLGALLGLPEPAVATPPRPRHGVAVIYGDRSPRSVPRLGSMPSEDGGTGTPTNASELANAAWLWRSATAVPHVADPAPTGAEAPFGVVPSAPSPRFAPTEAHAADDRDVLPSDRVAGHGVLAYGGARGTAATDTRALGRRPQ